MEAAGIGATAKMFGLPEHRVRRWIRTGLLTSRACGRRSIILFEDVRAVIRSMPPTKSSRRAINTQRELEISP